MSHDSPWFASGGWYDMVHHYLQLPSFGPVSTRENQTEKGHKTFTRNTLSEKEYEMIHQANLLDIHLYNYVRDNYFETEENRSILERSTLDFDREDSKQWVTLKQKLSNLYVKKVLQPGYKPKETT